MAYCTAPNVIPRSRKSNRNAETNAAKLLNEVEFSDDGQIAYANGFVHPIRTSVKLPDDLKKQFLPGDAYKAVKFPKDFVALDAAAKVISDGWAQLVQ
jgi:putative spermidine/putrescine transport system substrate-binding protein